MTSLSTERLIIRNFILNDWQALHQLIVGYQATEMAAFDRPWSTSEEEIKNITEWFATRDSFLAVCLKNTGRLIGYIGLNLVENQGTRTYELGYAFDADYHGQGFATEACKAILEHAFSKLQAEKVIAGTAEVNQPSIRLLERMGFKRIGEERVSFRVDEKGNPINFLGYKYELPRDSWKNKTSLHN